MLVVDNSERKDFAKNVKKASNEFIRRPIQNRVDKDWIKKELQIRKG